MAHERDNGRPQIDFPQTIRLIYRSLTINKLKATLMILYPHCVALGFYSYSGDGSVPQRLRRSENCFVYVIQKLSKQAKSSSNQQHTEKIKYR